MKPLQALLLSSLVVAIGLSSGCSSGSKGSKVTGKLMNNGTPYLPTDKISIGIVFETLDKTGKTHNCIATPDAKTGEFTLAGPTVGQGVLPGKYKVAIKAGDSSNGYKDVLKDAFSEAKTPLTYEVDATPIQKIVIDIGKKTVTKD